MRRMLTVFVAVSLVLGFAIAVSFAFRGVARAQDQAPAAPQPGVTDAAPAETEQENQLDISGVVKALDAKANTMTVTYKEPDENDQLVDKTLALKIAEDAKVSIDDAEAALKDVRVGDQVLISYKKDEKAGNNATEIAVTRMKEEEGVCKSVDLKAKQLVLTVAEADAEGKETNKDVTYTLPADVPVMMDGRDAALKDIMAGDQIVMSYLEDTPGQKVIKQIDIIRESVTPGKVKSIDAKTKKLVLTVTMEDAEGKEVQQDQTLDLAAEVIVVVNNEESKLDQVKAEDDVWITSTQAPGGPKTVTQIEVERPQPPPPPQ